MLVRESWAYGVALIVVTMVIHTTGVVLLGLSSVRFRDHVDRHERPRIARVVIYLIVHVVIVGLVLTAMHGLESAAWASVYERVGAVRSFSDALLFSLSAMTNGGASAVTLPDQWQMMGALEALNGIILFGISTAFLFSVLQVYWFRLSARLSASPAPGHKALI